jgi:hypothetical protein
METLKPEVVGIATRSLRKDKSLRPYSSAQQNNGTDCLQKRGNKRKGVVPQGVVPSNQQLLSVSGSILTTGKHLSEKKRRPYSASPAVPIIPISDHQFILQSCDSQLTEPINE